MRSYAICALLFLSCISVAAKTEQSCGLNSWQLTSHRHLKYRHRRRLPAIPTRRIIGGTESKPMAWPWMAYLMMKNHGGDESRCGATLVADRWLLTAAHCVGEFSKGTALIGYKDVHDWFINENYLIEHVIPHPGYDFYDNTSHNHDIALVKLRKSVDYNDYVQPICLTSDDSNLFSKTYDYGYVTGWGYHSKPIPEDLDSNTTPNSTAPPKHYVLHGFNDKLLEAKIPFIDYEKCRNYWPGYAGAGHICAGAFQAGTSMGDSGGPLQVKDKDGHWYLVGITCFGAEKEDELILDQETNPGVYTRVSQYCKFIAEYTDGIVVCSPGSTDDGKMKVSQHCDYIAKKTQGKVICNTGMIVRQTNVIFGMVTSVVIFFLLIF